MRYNMNLKKHYDIKEGYTELFSSGDGISKNIDLGIISLNKTERYKSKSNSKEIVLIIISGKCSVKVGDKQFNSIGKRKNVFEGRAFGIYIPPEHIFEIVREESCEIAVCGTHSDRKDIKPYIIMPEENIVRKVGRENWQRDVIDIVGPFVESQHFLIGETINLPGNWSSYPPHKHEIDDPPVESLHEEVYFFKINPPQGFGLQRVYTDDGELDETYTIMNNDAVFLPRGYHPVASAGGYSVYYLWVLVGDKRKVIPHDDPNHAWLNK
jgi:5-deoxy-glucuronate isomerase